MDHIVHQASPGAIGQSSPAVSGNSYSGRPHIESYPSPVLMPPPEGQAYVLVRDNLNAPRFEIGDVLQVDLRVVRCRWDGVYVIQLNGRQLVRYVQVRPGKDGRPSFYVFTASNRDLGFFVEFDDLVVLGEVKTVCCVRRV